MFFTGLSPLSHRRAHRLLAALLLTAAGALAAQDKPLTERLADIEEIARISPQRALRQLDQVQAEARRGTPAQQAAFLIVSSDAVHGLGRHAEAVTLADQAIEIGSKNRDKDIVAKAMLSKAYALFSQDETTASHQLVWQAEKLAGASANPGLRVQTLISSGQALAEEGSLARALEKLDAATTLARKSGDPLLAVISLRALAQLYDRMRMFDKGFTALDEGMRAARQMNSEGRLSMLKSTEYALAMDSGQMQRALHAQLMALELQRKLDAGPMLGLTLVNLTDCYLKLHDFPHALSYGRQALDQATALNDESLIATARLNIGQAYLAMGRLAEGRKIMDAGMAGYEKAGNKPELQIAMGEYADALAHAGDLNGAIAAYRRERELLGELFQKRRQKAMIELQEQYEADKRQRQIALLRQENQLKSTEIDNRRLQQRVWWLLALVFALGSAFVGILYRKVRRTNAQLEIKNQELKKQSSLDPLTALYNRRHFQEFMRGQQDSVRRDAAGNGDMVGAIFLLDVDHFKHINDTYGHGAGDAVLREVAASLRNILRETDMIVRWGGEEFLAFLPAVPRDRLDEVARRLLAGIPAHAVAYQGHTLSARVSIGFAAFPLAPGLDAISWERAVNIVDMALYLAKGNGRNRAYGIGALANLDDSALARVEQDLEQAWRQGQVALSIVIGE
jgi:diguanylate cyclase (GGDEF)-like protein